MVSNSDSNATPNAFQDDAETTNHTGPTPSHDPSEEDLNGKYAGPVDFGEDVWSTLSPEDRLAGILAGIDNPEHWYDPPILETLAEFYHQKAVWGSIKARARAIGLSQFDLELAVQTIVRRTARQKLLEAMNDDVSTISPDDLTSCFTESEWLMDETLLYLARYYNDAPVWMRLKVAAKKCGINIFDLEKAVRHVHSRQTALKPPTPRGLSQVTITGATDEAWKVQLNSNTRGKPDCDIANVSLILSNDPTWLGRLWWDVIRAVPMVDDQVITDKVINDLGTWFGQQHQMSCKNHRFLRRCVEAHCQNTMRDLMMEWLDALPPWDQTPRLHTWLADCAGTERTAYGRHVSASMPVAMVARAMMPGVLYRSVVILEGPEQLGKSSLVHALGGDKWTIELSTGMDTKEAHLMLKGAWVVELPELDAISHTEDSRIKAYFSARKDSYVPKYSNDRVDAQRRVVFIGTVNEKVYLRGQSGNSRYLPIEVTQPIDVDRFLKDRDQIFAEALEYFSAHPDNWWELSLAAEAEAIERREARRVPSVYEDDLRQWLDFPPPLDEMPSIQPSARQEITWAEIAQGFLKIDKEKWKDPNLQRQIGDALRAIGWTRAFKDIAGKTARHWKRLV